MAVTNRIFIAFAIEDETYRDFLVGQARNERSPFAFIDMSIKVPFDSQWKTNCRAKIKGCDGLIALLSHSTAKADGERWEIKCAREEGVRLIGLHIDSKNKAAIPSELSGCQVIEWSWPGIKKFIDSL
jgi:hypothetical protein